jgi:hypothetical protein
MTAWDEKPTSTCKGCGEEIRWIEFAASGKKHPVDPEPSSAGSIAVEPDGKARRAQPSYSGPKYVSHFETCSKRDEFRKPR